MRNWVFVKVTTDDGVIGWGEATTEWRTRSVVGAVEDLAPAVVGEDPFRIEHLWQIMHRQQFWKGGLVSMSALSGIDQALHDIKAQALGVPVYELLGGRVRDRIRLYDHLGGGAPDEVYGELSPARFAESAARSVADGYTAVKVLAVPMGHGLPSGAALRATGNVMAAVRDAVGDDVEIMVDLHGRCTPAAAIAFSRVLAEYRPWFVEEPCQPELVDELAAVAAGAGVPIALGERLSGRGEFLRVLRTGAVAVLQPDVCHCGGLSELRRIAALAEAFGVVVAPHNPLGPIATAHNLHFAAATPNWLVQEQMRNAVPWWDDVVTVPLVFRDGHADPPSGPGLGTAVDEAAAALHPPQQEPVLASRHLDGSVADR
jgi:galactonate dehydratase